MQIICNKAFPHHSEGLPEQKYYGKAVKKRKERAQHDNGMNEWKGVRCLDEVVFIIACLGGFAPLVSNDSLERCLQNEALIRENAGEGLSQ